MDMVRIQVLIPTYNNVHEIDRTIASVWEQDYGKENIWITVVDFSSDDGTFEKLLTYDQYHFGFYQLENPGNERLMISYAVRPVNFTRPGGTYSIMLVLYPGEYLYPGCLKKCADAFLRHRGLKPAMVICEADIMDEHGNIRQQKPLYETERIIDGRTEMVEYVNKGYQHQIFAVRTGYGSGRYKANGEANESRFWNKCARCNNEQYAVYMPDVLVCTKERQYTDELEEILHRWEAIISMIRFYESKYAKAFDPKYAEKSKENLAKYALWRSFKQYNREGGHKDAEDCYMIAKVIMPEIERTELYEKMGRLIKEQDQSLLKELDIFFSQEV